jgi:outer membrane receptor protein involved in Fe transport
MIETRFGSEFIEALPILGRGYQDVLALAPGVSDVDGDGIPNIHGARDTDVVTLVDGVSTTDPLTGKIGAQLNLESIQEIEIKTSGATAEFGRAQGGFVNIITKSGGNEFKGTFKFFWSGSLVDGDGAGADDPRLHAGVGEAGIREPRSNLRRANFSSRLAAFPSLLQKLRSAGTSQHIDGGAGRQAVWRRGPPSVCRPCLARALQDDGPGRRM